MGRQDEDSGVLLVIAYGDRKLRIEVGRGLEGELTDLQSGRIIRVNASCPSSSRAT